MQAGKMSTVSTSLLNVPPQAQASGTEVPMFKGKTFDELLEAVLLAEHHAKQRSGESRAFEVADKSANELHLMCEDSFLLGVA